MKSNTASTPAAKPAASAPPAATPAPDSPSAPDKSKARRIFLVDDHPVTRQGVGVLIDQEPDLVVCGQADSAPAALQMMQKIKPDLALVDITLKTTSGIELLKNVHALLPDLPVLIMSMHDESLYGERALRAGAKGYIMKHEASERILFAVRSVLDGDLYLSEKMKEKMLHRLVRSKKNEVVFTIDTLSDREMEVFQLIGNGFGTREIAEKLNLSIKTIDSYREHLKLKLRLDNGPDLVRHAIQWVRSESVI
jgi:DNA-binding NarL/FixJ family response regulator